MFVRTASRRDLQAIQDLLGETLHDTYDSIYGASCVEDVLAQSHGTSALVHWLEQPNAEFLIADDGKQLGGLAYAVSDATGKSAALNQLCVRPSCQGRGVGSMLLDEILESFPDATRFHADVHGAKDKAVSFYRGRGFEEVGEKVSDFGAVQGVRILILEMRR